MFIKQGYQYFRCAITNSDTSGVQAKLSPLDTGTVTDVEGNVYRTVRIGNQYWSTENLRTTKYTNGSAIGSKNWLFAGSPEGAQRMAIIYSLAATCKLNNINPYEYFVDVLPKVASYPANKIADLTPIKWKINKNQK